MYVSDTLLYLELPKTGSTTISHVLAEVDGGREVNHETSGQSKHGRFTSHRPGRFVLGSMRDPWDWYVSLWAYGCSGRGEVHKVTVRQTGTRRRWSRARAEGAQDGDDSPIAAARYAGRPWRRDPGGWQRLQADADDPELFRAWLRRLHDPQRRDDLPYRYWRSPLGSHVGLLTFRFLWLHARHLDDLRTAPGGPAAAAAQVERMVGERLDCDAVVRLEHVGDDLARALGRTGRGLADPERLRLERLVAAPRNASRHGPSHAYYDQETIALVARRDGVIAERFGYTPPDGP